MLTTVTIQLSGTISKASRQFHLTCQPRTFGTCWLSLFCLLSFISPSPLSGFSFSGCFMTHFTCMSLRSCCSPELCCSSPSFLTHTSGPPQWPHFSGSSCYYPYPGLSPKLQTPLRLSSAFLCLCVICTPRSMVPNHNQPVPKKSVPLPMSPLSVDDATIH